MEKRDLSVELGSIPSTVWTSGDLMPEAGWGAVDGKLLRENVRSKGALWLNGPDRILAEGRPG